MNGKEQRERIFGLDLVRVVANFFILSAHTDWIYPKSSGVITKIKDVFGFLGIEIFFVISGFFVGRTLYFIFLKEEFHWSNFLNFFKRRALRILPNYYFAVLINLAIVLYFNMEKVAVLDYFLLLQNLTTAPSYFFSESWSIPIKEMAYLLIVALLVAITFIQKNKFAKVKFTLLMVVLLVVFLVTKVLYNTHVQHHDLAYWNSSLRKVVVYRIDSIIIGILFALVYIEFPHFWRKSRYIALFVGIASTGLLVLLMKKWPITTSPFFWNVMLLPLSSLASALLLPFFSEWKTKFVAFKEKIQALSALSYSIYVLHYSIILFLLKTAIDTSHFTMIQLHFFTAFYFSITLFFSYLLHHYFEKPIAKYR